LLAHLRPCTKSPRYRELRVLFHEPRKLAGVANRSSCGTSGS
jgi:hypothetical protein